MSGHYNPARDPTNGSDSVASSSSNNQPGVTRIARIHQQPGAHAAEQSEASQYMERRPQTYLEYLEMEFLGQFRAIREHLRQWVWPLQNPEDGPIVQLVDINIHTEEVVPKNFIAQACRNDIELCKLRQALTEKIEECDKIREHWQSAIGELSDLKSSKQVFMVDDADMISKWNQLQFAIKNLAMAYLNNPISPKRLTQKQREFLESVNPLYQEFLSTEGRVHLLFQSLMWMHVTKRILLDPTKVWGKILSTAFDTLLRVGHDSTEDYHSWRAQTGGIIQNAKGVHNETQCYLKDLLHCVITRFVPKEKLTNEEDKKIIRRSVERIINNAIEIAVVFNQSRCAYRLKRVLHRERFNPEIMEYNEGCNAPQVDLMISPGLIKFGNSKGENYDQRLVLVKSHVCTLKRNIEEKGEKGDTNENPGKGHKEGKDVKGGDSLI